MMGMKKRSEKPIASWHGVPVYASDIPTKVVFGQEVFGGPIVHRPEGYAIDATGGVPMRIVVNVHYVDDDSKGDE